MIEQIADHVAPPGTALVEVSAEAVRAASLEAKFPLWGPESENLLALDSALAIAHGLSLRSLTDSVDDVSAWWGNRPWPARWLTDAEETRVLHP